MGRSLSWLRVIMRLTGLGSLPTRSPCPQRKALGQPQAQSLTFVGMPVCIAVLGQTTPEPFRADGSHVR